ncbi:MAG: hypothetical protein LBF26_01040 [Puniceicoccales bacterium]|jgi:protein tyrosine phosphatase|nr:hypothetical protein [Puniceicoccales bacterium]
MAIGTSDLRSVVAFGLTNLTTVGNAEAESLLGTTTVASYDLREIFDKLSVTSKREIQANVPFYVRWFCSKSTILYRYICKKVNPKIAPSLQKSFFDHQIKMRPPPKVSIAFPPHKKGGANNRPRATRPVPQQLAALHAKPAARQPDRPAPARPTASAQRAAAGAIDPATNEQRLANATTLTFVRHDGTQYVFMDQSGQGVTVKSSAELPGKCGKLKTLDFTNCGYIGQANFQGFKALETINFTGCSRLGYIDVSNCPNLKTLTLSRPLPPTASGKAALIATESPNLIIPEKTWYFQGGFGGCAIRYENGHYQYNSRGKLLRRYKFDPATMREVWVVADRSPDPTGLPLQIATHAGQPPPVPPQQPLPPPFQPGGHFGQPADAVAARPVQLAAVQGVSAVSGVNSNENVQRLANATTLKFKNVKVDGASKTYVFTDQTGQEIEVKDFNQFEKATNLRTLNMSGSDINSTQAYAIFSRCTSLEDVDFSNCKNLKCEIGTKMFNMGYCYAFEIGGLPNLKSINLSGTGITIMRINNCENLQTVNVSNSSMENLQITNCANLKNLNFTQAANLRCLRIIACAGLEIFDCSQNKNLKCLCLINCKNIKSITPPSEGSELCILNVSGCESLGNADFSHCREGLKVIRDGCPAVITTKPIPPVAGEQASAQEFMRRIAGKNFDQHNFYADDIIFSDMLHIDSRGNQRPRALLPFIEGHYPGILRADRWDESTGTAPNADLYKRHGISSDIHHYPNAYFAQVTDDYCITSSPDWHNTANFFQAFSRQIGDGPGLIVDLHCHGGEYFANDSESRITDVQRIGDTITLSDADLRDAQGNPVKKRITIETRRALVHGKTVFHVRVKGLPDNHTFSTEVQQRINAEVAKVRKQYGVTVTVSHCNGGMGRGPTQMYMDKIETAAREAQVAGYGCVCDWTNQKLPMVDGKINLAYVTRNMVLAGHVARHVCGQSTGQFLQLEKFTEDMVTRYAAPAAHQPAQTAPAEPTAAAQGPAATAGATIPEQIASKMMHEIFGEAFGRFNSELENIDPNDIEISDYGGRFRALTEFTKKHHQQCKVVFNYKALHTQLDASCYVRHRNHISPDSGIVGELENWFAIYGERSGSSRQADFSQITTGNRAYFLTCAPNENGYQAEFFQAYAAELALSPATPGLIVDLHSDNSTNVGSDDYLTENPPERLTDLETIGDIELPYESEEGNCHIQIRKAKINGQEFYHARVHNWPDCAALSPEVMSLINAEIEKLCNEHGIQKVTIHCNGGVGRAPTMMYCNSVERAAIEANKRGLGCCCDWNNQTQPMSGGKVNLAYVMRNMLLTGHAIRSTCGQSEAQFKLYKTFTEEMATKYGAASTAA